MFLQKYHLFNTHMRKQKLNRCKSISDKDFIFDVFKNKGFVSNANAFLQTTAKHEAPHPTLLETEESANQETDK